MTRSLAFLSALLLALPLAAQEVPLTAHARWVIGAAFSADGKTLYTVGGESLLYRPGDVKVWEVESGKLLASLEGGHPTSVWAVAVSPDNKTLVTTGYDGKVVVWNLDEKKPRATLDKHKGWVRSVAMTADGSHFATGGEDGQVVIWTTADAKEASVFKAHDAAVLGLAFSPDKSRLASCGGDKLAKLWDWHVDLPAEKAKFDAHQEQVWSVAFSPDGATVASSGADRKVRLWTAADGKETASLDGHKDWVGSVAWSKENVVASGSHDRTVKLWNVGEKKELRSFPVPATAWDVAFSADGKLLAAGTHSSLHLFDVATKMEKFPRKMEEKAEKKSEEKPAEKKAEEKK